jgi:hypothetical protein
MTRHTAIVHRDDAALPDPAVRWDDESWASYVPLRPASVIIMETRLPPGAAAAVLNQAHTYPDLVLFLDSVEKRLFEAIDGRRSIAESTSRGPELFERLWQHDHIVIDGSGGGHTRSE